MEKKLYYTLLSLLIVIVIALLVIAAPPNGHDVNEIDFNSPISQLHVITTSAGSTAGIILEHDSNTGGSPRVYLVDTKLGVVSQAPSWSIDNVNDRFRIFRQPNIDTPGEEFFTVTNDGKVGIGTPAPVGRLQISGDKNAASTLFLDSTVNDGSTGSFLMFSRLSVAQKTIGLEGTNDLSITQGTGSDNSPANRMYMRFLTNGNIQFGNGDVVIHNLGGSGNDYVCVNSIGKIFRSSFPC